MSELKPIHPASASLASLLARIGWCHYLCGNVGGGLNGVVMSALTAFTSGELFTFAAGLDEWLYEMQPGGIVPYNFADLPCLPYKIMVSLGPH